MTNGIIPFTQYFPQQTLMGAKMQGEQLRGMQQQRRQQEAKQQAMSDVYGSPEEAARQDIMGQQQAQKFDMFAKSMDFLDNVYDTHGSEAVEAIKGRPEIAQNLSSFVDPASLTYSRDRKGTIRTRLIPSIDTDGMTKEGKPMTLKANTPYVRVKDPDGTEYFIEDIKTTKDVAGIKADTTALVKNTAFIAKTLKIPQEKALQMALESKSQSREAFILDMIKRAMTASMGRLKPDKLKSIEENAGSIWDSLHDKDKASPEVASEGEQDWLANQMDVIAEQPEG